jgi:3-hydroxyisobutyrate dehydrogenase
MDARRIGLIGLGRMGRPIRERLEQAGHRVTAGSRHEGADAPAVAAAADVLITVLPSHVEVAAVLDEALGALAPGAVWIDMSTCAPREGQALAERAEAVGVRWLEAPLGGGVDAAETGTLQLFAGGDPGVLDGQRELLGAVSSEIRHMGGHGAGYTTKLLINLLWFGQAVAGAEALLIARRQGLDLELVRDAIAASPAANHFLESDIEAPRHGYYLASFGIHRCVDELHAVTELARDLDLPHDLASTVERIHAEALDRYGAVDGELLAVALLEERARLRLRD